MCLLYRAQNSGSQELQLRARLAFPLCTTAVSLLEQHCKLIRFLIPVFKTLVGKVPIKIDPVFFLWGGGGGR